MSARRTYCGDGRTDATGTVCFPLTRATESLDVAYNILCHCPSAFGWHETQWTKETTEFGSNSAKQARCADNGGGSVTIVENLLMVRLKQSKSDEGTHTVDKFEASDDVSASLLGFLSLPSLCKHQNLILRLCLDLYGKIHATTGHSNTISYLRFHV